MNLPNKLTLLRVVLIPVFFFFYFASFIPNHFLLAFIIFVGASLTDLADGQIARNRGLITNFGKLMDPLADKLLVLAAVIVILAPGYGQGVVPQSIILPFSWISLYIVLGRDLVVNAIRLVAAADGIVIAADNFGKLKTIFQMIWLCLCLFLESLRKDSLFVGLGIPQWLLKGMDWVGFLLFAIMMFFTIVSGFNYVWKNKTMFQDA